MVCFAFTHFTLDDRLSMCVYLLFLLSCHQKGWKEVKRKHPYRDERNQEKIYHGPNLSPISGSQKVGVGERCWWSSQEELRFQCSPSGSPSKRTRSHSTGEGLQDDVCRGRWEGHGTLKTRELIERWQPSIFIPSSSTPAHTECIEPSNNKDFEKLNIELLK